MLKRLTGFACLASVALALGGGCVEQKRIDRGYAPATGGFAPMTSMQPSSSSPMGYQPFGTEYRGNFTGPYTTLGKPRAKAFSRGGPKPATFGQTEVFSDAKPW